jgi:hypothetical protein
MTKCRSMVEVTPALASNRHSLVDQYHQLGGRCRRELASKSAKPMLSPSDTRGSGSSLFDRKDANPRGILVTCRFPRNKYCSFGSCLAKTSCTLFITDLIETDPVLAIPHRSVRVGGIPQRTGSHVGRDVY